MVQRTWIPALVALLLAAAPDSEAQDDEDRVSAESVRSHYTKCEHRIPMRDGKRLFTAVYVPNDVSQSWPILMVRTPYDVGSLRRRPLQGESGP